MRFGWSLEVIARQLDDQKLHFDGASFCFLWTFSAELLSCLSLKKILFSLLSFSSPPLFLLLLLFFSPSPPLFLPLSSVRVRHDCRHSWD